MKVGGGEEKVSKYENEGQKLDCSHKQSRENVIEVQLSLDIKGEDAEKEEQTCQRNGEDLNENEEDSHHQKHRNCYPLIYPSLEI